MVDTKRPKGLYWILQKDALDEGWTVGEYDGASWGPWGLIGSDTPFPEEDLLVGPPCAPTDKVLAALNALFAEHERSQAASAADADYDRLRDAEGGDD